ncbi:MAG: FAD-dependent monooxygenase [Halobacteriales archaeon]
MFSPAVVGGGVCGLTAGLVLQQEGHDPTVYERAPEPDPTEVGVVVGTNGMRTLDHVGVAPSVTGAGQSIDRARILEANGRTLATVDFAGYEGREFGWTPVSVDRRVVIEALHEALAEDAIEFGRECTGAAHQSGREQVQFADGEAVPTELLVGADGPESAVRGSMFPDVTPRSTG